MPDVPHVEPEARHAEAPRSRTSFRAFLRDELTGAFATFGRVALGATLALGLFFSVVFLVMQLRSDMPRSDDASLPVLLLVAVVAGFAYGAPLGLACGVIALMRRLFGAWFLLPLVITPLAVLGAFWLAAGPLGESAGELLDALVVSARHHGLEHTRSALEGGRVAHAGGPVALLVLAFALPFLLADALVILFDAAVLVELGGFVLGITATFVAGVLASGVLTLPPLVFAFVRRLRARYRARDQASGRAGNANAGAGTGTP